MEDRAVPAVFLAPERSGGTYQQNYQDQASHLVVKISRFPSSFRTNFCGREEGYGFRVCVRTLHFSSRIWEARGAHRRSLRYATLRSG